MLAAYDVSGGGRSRSRGASTSVKKGESVAPTAASARHRSARSRGGKAWARPAASAPSARTAAATTGVAKPERAQGVGRGHEVLGLEVGRGVARRDGERGHEPRRRRRRAARGEGRGERGQGARLERGALGERHRQRGDGV